MSHVDEGELTAYADGAYPVNDPVALRISAHLSTCANCRTRVEQSQDLRSRATEILAYAAPAGMHTPAFETLQAQVRPRRIGLTGMTSLAWAATVVLALGIGWFGRGAFQGVPAREMIAVPDGAAPGQDAATPTVAAPQPTETRAADVRARREQPVASAVQPANGAATDQARTAQAEEPQGFAAGQAAASNAPERAVTERITQRTTTERAAADRAAAGRTATPPPSAAAAPAPAPVPTRDSNALRARENLALESVVSGTIFNAAEAERAGIVFPRIPELPVSSVVVSANDVVVSQTLADGRVVRLTGVAATAPQEGGRAAERLEMQKQVQPNITVRVGDKLVTVTADLPPDSLRALAGKIR